MRLRKSIFGGWVIEEPSWYEWTTVVRFWGTRRRAVALKMTLEREYKHGKA